MHMLSYDNQPPTFLQMKKTILREDDDGTQLLFNFGIYMNIILPNVQIARKDWDEVQKRIHRMVQTKTYREYALVIAEMAAQTGDPHLEVIDNEDILINFYGKYYLQCELMYVENKVIINQVGKDEKNLKVGDILLSIDGIELEKRIKELKKYKAIPEEDKFVAKIKYQLMQTEGKTSEVIVLRDGEEKKLKVNTSEEPYMYENPQKNGFIEEEKIGYIDPSALKEGDLEKLMEKFADTEGIIVDLRYYPSSVIAYSMAEYINPEMKEVLQFVFPNQLIREGIMRFQCQ